MNPHQHGFGGNTAQPIISRTTGGTDRPMPDVPESPLERFAGLATGTNPMSISGLPSTAHQGLCLLWLTVTTLATKT
jgi:hypothetical protein